MKQGIVALLFAVLTVTLSGTSFAAEPTKIGVVDFQKIINDSKQGKEAKDILTKEGEYKSNKLKSGEEALKKKFADLEKQRTALSPEAFAKRQEEVMAERDKFRDQVETFQADLRKKEQEYTQDILVEVQAVIKEMAEKEGFALVLEKTEAGVLYAPEKFDLTERALQAYDASKAAAAAKKK